MKYQNFDIEFSKGLLITSPFFLRIDIFNNYYLINFMDKILICMYIKRSLFFTKKEFILNYFISKYFCMIEI